MELEKLKIKETQFQDTYVTEFAKIEKYKHLRITACATEPCKLYIEWSYDMDEVCLENCIRLPKEKYASDKVEIVAPYCRIKVMAETEAVVEKLVVNVLGRHDIQSGDGKIVKIEDDPPNKPETPRHKSPFHKFVSHKRQPQATQHEKQQGNDPRLPAVMFKNSLLYVTNTLNSCSTLPFPPNDGNEYVLSCCNNVLDWKKANHI